MAYIQSNNPIPKTGCGRRRMEKMNNPFMKKVPNCIPRGSGDDKLPKPPGDPCWETHVQRGMKDK